MYFDVQPTKIDLPSGYLCCDGVAADTDGYAIDILVRKFFQTVVSEKEMLT